MSRRNQFPYGVSFNYLQTLWANIGVAIKLQREGMREEALHFLAEFVGWLPEDLQTEFTGLSEEILACMDFIAAGEMPEIKEIDDIFLRAVMKRKVMRLYCSQALSDFITRLTKSLCDKGYYLAQRDIPTGQSHTMNKDYQTRGSQE